MASVVINTRFNNRKAEADLKELQAKAKETAREINAVEKGLGSATTKRNKLRDDLEAARQKAAETAAALDEVNARLDAGHKSKFGVTSKGDETLSDKLAAKLQQQDTAVQAAADAYHAQDAAVQALQQRHAELTAKLAQENGKLARATASEAQVLAGAPFYAGNKALKIGMMRNHGSWPDADKLTIESGKLKMYKQDGYTEGGLGVAATNLGNAQAEHLLSGVSASSQNGLGFGGSMPDRSGWSATITPGGVVTIPEGYHAGGGMVSAKGIQVTEVWQSCHRGQNLFDFSGGTLVGVQYAGSQYASDNILQGAGINSGSQYWAQCASDASVRFILAYY